MGLGLSEEDAKYYEERVNSGAILVAVPAANEDAAEVTDIFAEFDATDVKTINVADDRIMNERAERESITDDAKTVHTHEHSHAFAGAKGGRAKKRTE